MPPQTLIIFIYLFLLSVGVQAQPATADSLYRQQARLLALQDSLNLGIGQLDEAWRQVEREPTDSLKYLVQDGLGKAWRTWAMKAAPRRGMAGDDILRLADLHAALNRFDLEGCYNEQLECYKRAMMMPGCEERALRRLHTEYLAAGFAPGMIQTGQRLMELDTQASLEMGVARSMALAYYFVGDRKEAKRWVKRHLRQHPDDVSAQDLLKRIRKPRRQSA